MVAKGYWKRGKYRVKENTRRPSGKKKKSQKPGKAKNEKHPFPRHVVPETAHREDFPLEKGEGRTTESHEVMGT